MFKGRRDWRGWTAALILTALIVCFYWKLAFSGEFTWLSGNDTVVLLLPWFQFQAGEWHKGRLPLWDPRLFGGQPFLAQANNGAAYPPNWALFAMPLREGWMKEAWLNWYFVIIHLMAAWLAYRLAREMGASRRAGVLGGMVFSLSGWMGQNDWPQLLNGAVWAPLVLLYVFRAIEGKQVWRSTVLGGFFLGVSWLSGHHQMPLLISLTACGIWLWGMRNKWRLAGPFLTFWAVAICAGALAILPALEYGRLAVRWAGAAEPSRWADVVPYDVHVQYELHPAALLGIVIPGVYFHADPYLGVTALALALAGLAGWRKSFRVRAVALAGVGGLLLALVEKTPFHGLLYSVVPLVEKARHTSSAVVLFGLAAAMLAACGVDRLLQRGTTLAQRIAKVALGFGIAVFGVRFFLILLNGWPGVDEVRSAAAATAALLLAAMLLAWQRGALAAGAFVAGLLSLFMIEAGNSASFHFPSRMDEKHTALLRSLGAHGDIAGYLRDQNHLFRVDVDDRLVAYNFGDWHGLDQTTGYTPGVTESAYRLEWSKPWIKRLMGVEYAISTEPTEFHKQAVFEGRSGVKVFRNPDVLPRAFLVHEAEKAENPVQLMVRMGALADALDRRTVMVDLPPALERCEGFETAWASEYSPSRVAVRLETGCRAMLILTDTWYPGWEAKVDGRDARIWQAYGSLRGVVVEKGSHEVVFRFRPKTVFRGGLLSAFTGVLAACVAWCGRRKQDG